MPVAHLYANPRILQPLVATTPIGSDWTTLLKIQSRACRVISDADFPVEDLARGVLKTSETRFYTPASPPRELQRLPRSWVDYCYWWRRSDLFLLRPWMGGDLPYVHDGYAMADLHRGTRNALMG
jgi:hypothetical protein